MDALGRPFLTIDDNGVDTSGHEKKYTTRLVLDLEGNQRRVIDAKGRLVMGYTYDMLSVQTGQDSMEADSHRMFNDVTEKPLYTWDSGDHRLRYGTIP